MGEEEYPGEGEVLPCLLVVSWDKTERFHIGLQGPGYDVLVPV